METGVRVGWGEHWLGGGRRAAWEQGVGTSEELWGELGAAAAVGWAGAGPGWSSRPGHRGLGLLGTRCQARAD